MINKIIHIINLISEAWFRFIGQQFLISFIIFGIVLFLILIIRRKSLWLQVGLWGLIFLKLIIPANLGTGLHDEVEYLKTFLSKDQNTKSPIYSPINISNIQTENNIDNSQLKELNDNTYSGPVDQKQSTNIGITKHKQTNQIKIIPLVFFLFWIIGISVLIIHLVNNINKLNRTNRSANLVTDKKILKILDLWCNTFKINRVVEIYTGDKILTTYTSGLFTPKLFIPKELIMGFNLKEIEPIIAHELAHIKNYDFLIAKFQNIVSLFYFFNPIIWIANSKINLLREEICDSLILKTKKISSNFYSQILIKVAQENYQRDNLQYLPLLKFGNSKQKFKRRLKMATKNNIYSFSKLQKIFLLLLLTIVLPLGFNSSIFGQKFKKDESYYKKEKMTIYDLDTISVLQPEPDSVITFRFDTYGFQSNEKAVTEQIIKSDTLGSQKDIDSIIIEALVVVQHNKNFKALKKRISEIQQLQELYEMGVLAYQQNNWQEAMKYFNKVKMSEPNFQSVSHYFRESERRVNTENQLYNKQIINSINNDKKESNDQNINYHAKDIDIYLDNRSEFPKLKGKMIWPVKGNIIKKFGKQKNEYNIGIEIETAHGETVNATCSGIVAAISQSSNLGNIVMINHSGGYRTFFAHLSEVNILIGEKVYMGKTIGKVGSFGKNSGSKLYFGIWQKIKAIDPEIWLSKN